MPIENSHDGAGKLTFADALDDAGGVDAPRERVAWLRAWLLDELAAGAAELELTRSGYGRPVAVAFAVAPDPGSLLAVAPVDQALHADPGAVGERAWLLTAALVGAMVEVAAASAHVPPGAPEHGSNARRGRPNSADGLTLDLRAGAMGSWLALALALPGADGGEAAELAVLAFEDQSRGIDRLRARAHAVPFGVLDGIADLRPPIGEDHPLLAAEAVARLGGWPADEASVAAYEDEILAVFAPGVDTARPHEEQDPALRAARRILQRLAGMGKWGGYHTDVAHLARGFAGNERALAMEVGERLISAGLLASKPSVGQRHVFLNPRRAGDIHALIERGVIAPGLKLPET